MTYIVNDIQKYRLSLLEVKNLQTISALPPLLSAYEIHVFTLHLPDIRSAVPRLFALLSTSERQRAERFHFDRDADLFVAAHGMLRVILAHYLQLFPQDISFTICSGGKPILSPDLHPHPVSFNISHSGETVLVGVAADVDIGVDVETVRPFDNFMEIAENYFHPIEFQSIAAISRDKQLRKFYEIWTQKEAVVKALGMGLSLPLDSFQVSGELNSWGKTHFLTSQNKKCLYSRQICRQTHSQGALSLNVPFGEWEKIPRL